MEGEQTSTLGPSAPLAWVADEFPLNSTLQSWGWGRATSWRGVGGTRWTVGSTRDEAGETADGVLTQS